MWSWGESISNYLSKPNFQLTVILPIADISDASQRTNLNQIQIMHAVGERCRLQPFSSIGDVAEDLVCKVIFMHVGNN